MSYTIRLSPDGTYVILKVVGQIDRRTAMAQNVEADAFAKKHGVRKYLVDLIECRNVESDADNYAFAYEDMMNAPLDREARIAFLVHPDDHSHDFVETVSRNAGLDVTLFRDRKLAEAHLRD